MNYKGFYITRCADSGIERTDKNGKAVLCDGFFYQVFTDEDMCCEIDNFCGAVGFELPDNTAENADLFAREMVECEYKEYCRVRDEMKTGGLQLDY